METYLGSDAAPILAQIKKMGILLPVTGRWSKIASPESTHEMVKVPSGCFQMGSKNGYNNEKPEHKVCLDEYWIGKYEITVGQFREFINATGYQTDAEKKGKCWNSAYSWKKLGFSQGEDHPVACVSWNDAQEYMRWLGGKGNDKYRLPTEAEWEYVCRSGGKAEKYAGGAQVGIFR